MSSKEPVNKITAVDVFISSNYGHMESFAADHKPSNRANKFPGNMIFWEVTPHSSVDRYQRFGSTYYLHLQGTYDSLVLDFHSIWKWRQQIPPHRTHQPNDTASYCRRL